MPRQGSYTNQEFFDDLERVAEGEPFDRALVELLVRESANAVAWMETLGVRWQSALEGTLQLAHTNWFFLGGGKR
jgi:tricarballylate dehydrogenase